MQRSFKFWMQIGLRGSIMKVVHLGVHQNSCVSHLPDYHLQNFSFSLWVITKRGYVQINPEVENTS